MKYLRRLSKFSHTQMVHLLVHLRNRLSSTIPRKHLPATALSLLVVGISIFFGHSLLFPSTTIHKGEFTFAERSYNSKTSGSVLPASCGSYPDFGTNHGDYDSNNTAGHCAVSGCPSGYSINYLSLYRNCGYSGNFRVYDTAAGGYIVVISSYMNNTFASQSCSPLPDNTTMADGSTLLSTREPSLNTTPLQPVCSAPCWDGSWAIPHIGRSCPAQPVPTVNLNFN